MPTRMAVRDGPAQRTAWMKPSCESPGTASPIRRNGQSSEGASSVPDDEKGDQCGDEEGGRRDHNAAEHRIAATEEAGAHGHGHRAEERAREEPEEDGVHLIL